jgi:hypothetical protein
MQTNTGILDTIIGLLQHHHQLTLVYIIRESVVSIVIHTDTVKIRNVIPS